METQDKKKICGETRITNSFASLIGALVVVCCCVSVACAQPSGQTPPRVEIAGSQLLHLSSAITKADYDLYINLPRGYGDTTKTFPVLFLIDAQWDFTFVQALYGQQYFDGFIPEMVIVGITWGGKDPDYDKLRAHDLTPTDVSHNGTYGNAPKFLSFITKEVIPFVEKNYRVDHSDRTLMGSSFGGLFTLYAMFQEPGVFKRYVLTSPAIQWDNRMIYSLNKTYAEQHKDLPAKMFIGIGGYENVTELQKFVDELKAKDYQHFVLESKASAGMGHSGGKAEGYSRGLQFVFARQDLRVAPAVLAAYAGDYTVNGQNKLTLLVDNDVLVGIAPDNSRISLKAESNTEFYVPGQFLNAHIEKDAAGKVTGMTLHQYSGDVRFKKVQ
jgi:hypothetical protein